MTNATSSPDKGGRPGGVTIGDVQGSIVNSIIAGGDVIQKFFVGDQAERDRKNKLYLLEKVTAFWIQGVLEKSVHGELLIELQKQESTAAVDRPWDAVLADGGHDGEPVPSAKSILQVFREQGQALVILGEPGGGKTITLLELARDAAALAADDTTLPIPVVLNLSSWTAQGRALADWLVQDLKDKYQVPAKQGRSWIENNDLLLLLDGLDEVEESRRGACAEAINRFRAENGLTPMAVCCRMREYDALRTRLKLQGAVVLRPLTAAQIDQYFERAGPSLANVRALVQGDAALKELAQTPLMLSVMSLAYQEPAAPAPPGAGTAAQSPTDTLFSAYVARMVRYRKTRHSYPPEVVRSRLAWLARRMLDHSQSMFLLENLQPSWLASGRQRWLYVLGTRLAVTSVVWLGLLLIGAVSAPAIARGPGIDPALLYETLAGILFLFLGIGLAIAVVDGWRFRRQARSGRIAAPRPRGPLKSALDVLVTSLLALFGMALGAAALANPIGAEILVGVVIVPMLLLSGNLVSAAGIVIAVALTFGLMLGLRSNRGMLGHDIQPVESLGMSWRRFALGASGVAALVGGAALAYTSASRNPAARVWDAAGHHLADLESPDSWIETAILNREGTRIAAMVQGDNVLNVLRLYDAARGAEIGVAERVYKMRFTPDGRRLVLDVEGGVEVWDAMAGTKIISADAGGMAAEASPDGSRLVGEPKSTDGGGTATGNESSDNARLMDEKGNVLAGVDAAMDVSIRFLARFSADGSRLVVTGRDDKMRLWNAADGSPLGDLGKSSATIVFSPSGDRLATVGEDGRARLWNTDGNPVATLEPASSSSAIMEFSPDGSRLVMCHADAVARVWDARTGAPVSTLKPPRPLDCERILSFDPSGTRVLEYDNSTGALNTTGALLLFNAESGDLVLDSGTASYRYARLSPDGARLATTDQAGTVELWDGQSGHHVETLESEQGVVWTDFDLPEPDAYPVFTADGRRVVTLRADGTVRLADAQTGAPVASLPDTARTSVGSDQAGHPATVASLLSPDGRFLQTGSADGSLQLYSTDDGKPAAKLRAGTRRQGAWSADGQRIATFAEPHQMAPDHRLWSAFAIPFGLLAGLLFSLRRQIRESKTVPGEGIRLSARNGILMGVLAGLVVLMPICVALLFLQRLHSSDWPFWLSVFLLLFVLISLFSGMIDVIQYVVIRLLLWAGRTVPWRYARFLDHAADLILLRRVGGGYIFIHRLLLEYFARQSPGQPAA
jgi:WD40 repeat protein